MLRHLLAVPFALSLVACAGEDDACERAAAHVAACFPEHATAPVCDPATADAIADASCDEIASWDGKSDNPWCIWTPWLCSGGGTTSGRSIEVSVEECGPGGLCPYVQAASCGLVTLHDAGGEVARGFTSGGGRLTFEGLDEGTYTIKVHERDGTLATMMMSEFSDQTTSATRQLDVESGDAPWARFYLAAGTADDIVQCADVRGDVTFTDSSGAELDRREAEWSWLVELETDGAIELTRPLFIYPDNNVVGFRLLHQGTHTLRYIRMDIPSYERRPNPDYERLRRLYATDEAPIEQTIQVTASRFGQEIDVSRTVIDPLAP